MQRAYRFVFVFFCFSAFCLLGQEVKGIVLLDLTEPFLSSEELATTERLQVRNLRLPTDPEKLSRLLAPYFNKPLTDAHLQKIKTALVSYFESHGEFLSLVSFPDQRITDNVIQVRVARAKLGEVLAKGLGRLPKNLNWEISGIVLLGEGENPLPVCKEDVKQLYMKTVELPTEEEVLLETLRPFFGCTLTDEKLRELKVTLMRYFESHGQPLALVSIPDQQVVSDVVQVQIKQARFGDLFTKKLARLPKHLEWKIDGIVLLGDLTPPLPRSEVSSVQGIKTHNLSLPTGPEVLLDKLKPYLNQKLTQPKLREIQSIVSAYFRSHGQPLSAALFPDQQVVSNVLQIQICRSKLGELLSQNLGHLPSDLEWKVDSIVLLEEPPSSFNALPQSKELHVQDLSLPTQEKVLLERLKPFLHRALTDKTLGQIQETVTEYFREHDQHLSAVTFPDQQVVSNTLQIQIHRAKIGEILAQNLGHLPRDLEWRVKGIVLLTENESPLSFKRLSKVSGICTPSLKLPGNDLVLKAQLAPYLNAPLTEEKLQEIQAILSAHFESQGELLSLVSLPDQQLFCNVIQFQIVRAKLGEVFAAQLDEIPKHIEWKINAIVLLDENGQILSYEELSHLVGCQVPSTTLPTDPSVLQQALAPYLQRKLTDETLQEIKEALLTYFKAHGQPLSWVEFPDQQVVANAIQVQVARATFGEILAKNLGTLPEDLHWKVDTIVLLDEANQPLPLDPALEKTLAPLLSSELTQTKLDEIKQAIAQHVQSSEMPLACVEIPDQQVVTSTIQFKISKANLGQLYAQGLGNIPQDMQWKIDAIVLLDESEPVLSSETLSEMHGLHTRHLALPDHPRLLEEQLQPYFQAPLTDEKLQEIKGLITRYFEEHGQPLSAVIFPDQQVVGKAIQVHIARAPLGESFAERMHYLPDYIAATDLPDPNWQINGIVILGQDESLLSPLELSKVIGVYTDCFRLPTSRQTLQNQIEPYFHDPLDQETLENLRIELYRYFQKNDEPFVLITIPDQTIESKVVQVQIVRAKLGEVYYEGGRNPISRDAISTQPGEELYPSNLQGDLEWLNRYPFRKVDLIYEAGREPGTTDIVLNVREEAPWRIYLGTDNTGVHSLGRERAFAGFSFGLRDIYFTCQYTASYDFHRFQAVTAQFIGFLPWRHILNLYGGYSLVHASLPTPEKKSSGQSGDASLRYEIPFTPVDSMQHQMVVGGDFKTTNNTLEFSSVYERYSQVVNLTQLVLGYQGSWQKNRSRIDFLFNVFGSPGEWLPDMTDADYNSLRPGATNQWVYCRGVFRYLQKTTLGFSTQMDLRFQAASNNLIPSEQIGIGGAETVRGYDERQLNYDQGFIGNFEIRTPPIVLISAIRHMKVKDSIQFLVFFDYGIGTNYQLIPGEAKSEYLMGVGPGLRYTLDPWIAFRLDWGFKLHTNPSFTGGPSMLHFGLTGSF